MSCTIRDEKRDRVIGGILGVVVGDCLGFPVEGRSRDFLKKNPVTGLERGVWSDDSSLTLCLADSLISGYDLNDIADKFIKWFKDGYWTPYGVVLDIGYTTREAIIRLMRGVKPTQAGLSDEYSNGNGSLMRILPLVFYVERLSLEEQFKLSEEVSSITHAHPRAKISCGIYVQYALQLLRGEDKRTAYNNMKEIVLSYYSDREPYRDELFHFNRILKDDISRFLETDIKSTGYVIHTLEASLWSFLNTDSFKEAVLKAVNLGDDSDSTGAVTGGIAGIFYGVEAIPKEWIKKIIRYQDIVELVEEFYKAVYKK